MRYLVFLFGFLSFQLYGQDLISLLDSPNPNPVTFSIFKDSRIVNAQSCEQSSKGELKFLIQHRFGTINQGSYGLWGIDDAKVRFGFEYGLTDFLTISLGRSSDQKEYDTALKFAILNQTNSLPFTFSTYSAFFQKHPAENQLNRSNFRWSDYQSLSNQLIFSRKFSREFSFAFLPTHLYSYLSDSDLFLGFGGRYKLSNRVSVNGEYFYPFEDQLNLPHYLALGFDIDTGGHVFSLHISNSRGMNERAFLTDYKDWTEGNIYFGFNISRNFAW
jgi:hypothetical protein